MKRKLVLFGSFAAFATVALFAVGWGQRARDWDGFQVERAVRIARSVAWRVVHPADDTDLQAFVEDVAERVDGVDEALVLKRVKFLAHTGGRAGERLERDSLSDKRLYDLGQRLDANVRKNIEERERNPELLRDAYAEYVLAGPDENGDFRVSVPAKADGEYEALVQVRMSPVGRPARLPWGLIGIFLAAGLAFAALARVFETRGLLLLGGGLLLAVMLAAQSWYLVQWRSEGRLREASVLADTYASLAHAGLFQATADADAADDAADAAEAEAGAGADVHADADAAADALVRSLGLTLDGRPRGQLVAVSKGDGEAADLVEMRSDGWSVFMAPDWFRQARAEDARHLAAWAGAIGFLMLLGFGLGVFGQLARGWRGFVRHRSAYKYLTPAMFGMLVLVFIPVAFGLALGFMQRRYNVFEFAGLSNYLAILSDFDFADPQNFYFKLGVTAMWTFLNVGLHVSIGLFLALLLNDPMLKARGPLRVLLIVPWAVPNYITALIWKGMFHKQFGAVNYFLEAMGLEPVSWFQSFWPAFSTNVITNTWLGFPFMMVISLGALQSIPSDLYEAARVDGAGRWHRFRYVTLPLLMPALVPAVIVGTVWTFNMFNIIYLVSGGAPNGATDILITDAFRWAFERDRYGYAAAYSTLIFFILMAFTLATNRITGATKGAFE